MLMLKALSSLNENDFSIFPGDLVQHFFIMNMTRYVDNNFWGSKSVGGENGSGINV